jgi:hypothetical protein
VKYLPYTSIVIDKQTSNEQSIFYPVSMVRIVPIEKYFKKSFKIIWKCGFFAVY